MIKKSWIVAFVIFDLFLVGAAAYYFVQRSDPAKKQPVVNQLPALVVTQLDGAVVPLDGLDGKVILIFFNPGCEHCQNEARAMSENKRAFRDYNLFFISSDEAGAIGRFAGDFQLTDSNFHFCRAEMASVFQAVGPLPSIPTIYIFNEKRLVKKLEGETRIEELIGLL